ncbi:zinc ABC transporter substrate-binding protein [Candidatus Micrarchaeota archaeon]|nr:zinc ABC transporter substrate-binding protein [Candidatus Micrarchaeota archaeon]
MKSSAPYYKLLVAFGFAVLLLFGCTTSTNRSSNNSTSSDGKLLFVASFYPIEQIVSGVAGERAVVYSLVPAGTEPHDYEPTSADVRKLSAADAYFALGSGFSAFEEQAKNALSGQTPSFDLSTNITHLTTNGKIDPHIWVSPRLMKQMTEVVYLDLIHIDPTNAQSYRANADGFEAKLDQLDSDFATGLSHCNKSIILTSHAAFGYLALDYNLTQVGVSGLDPESEPTPSQIRELIDLTRQHNMKYLFYEELVDPRVSQTIANEAGAKTLELNPLEGSKNKQNYFQIQRRNLQNLRLALECS